MTIKEIYKFLNENGGFTTDTMKLNGKQEQFLISIIEDNGEDIELDDLLEVIAEYREYEDAELNFCYDSLYNLAYDFLDSNYNIPYFLQDYIDYDKLGENLLEGEGYFELKDGRILCINI